MRATGIRRTVDSAVLRRLELGDIGRNLGVESLQELWTRWARVVYDFSNREDGLACVSQPHHYLSLVWAV